jgi:integrase
LKTTKEKEAKSRALRIERELLASHEVEQRQAPLIEDAADEYIAHLQGRKKKKKTTSKYKHCFKLMMDVARQLGVQRLDQVDHRFIDAFRNMRAKYSKPKTVLNDLVTIRQLVNFALQRKLLSEDPLAGLQFDKPVQVPQPYWSREQALQILEAANPIYRPIFHCLADTGTRIGEAIWLTWDDVDFENGVIHIQAKEDWAPKTGDERTISMSASLRQTILQQPRMYRWVFVAQPSWKYPQKGRQVSSRLSLAHLKRVLKRQGLPGHQHTFRHSFISHALTNSTPEAIVRHWVGHVDHKIMERYTHIADPISKGAMANLFATEGEQEDLGSSHQRKV